ncbi:MAG: hypothetical protein WCF18_04010 [Chthoniobacteraceae bacterium]
MLRIDDHDALFHARQDGLEITFAPANLLLETLLQFRKPFETPRELRELASAKKHKTLGATALTQFIECLLQPRPVALPPPVREPPANAD